MQQTQLPHFISGLHGCRMDSHHQQQQHLLLLRPPPGTLQQPSSLAGNRGFSTMHNSHLRKCSAVRAPSVLL
ncbi:uncharacterized [Lates japonicus]